MQRVYANPDLHERLKDTNEMFSNFISKLELWGKLENQYDYSKDQAQTQKKLEEIYENLKKQFSNDSDEKQQNIKNLMDNLKGKTVPEEVMKIINEEMQRFM